MGMDWLSKRKFVIVCHEKVLRIPLEGDEILRVHGERTQGVVKTLMNTKVDEPKLSDISIVRDFIDVFSEYLSMTTTMTRRVTKTSKSNDRDYPLSVKDRTIGYFNELQGRERASRNVARPGPNKWQREQMIGLYGIKLKSEPNVFERGYDHSVGVRGMIIGIAKVSVFKKENGTRRKAFHGISACCNNLRYLSENEIESPWILSVNFQGQNSEYDVVGCNGRSTDQVAHFPTRQEISQDIEWQRFILKEKIARNGLLYDQLRFDDDLPRGFGRRCRRC
ncbi:hypothetical protein Tco_1394334 [Tanacetum coccineum]